MDPVAICNMALGFLSKHRINDLIEGEEAADSDEQELCSTFYPIAVRLALEEKGWLFATGSRPVDLGAPQESGDPQYPVLFALPADLVTVRRVVDANGDSLLYERREGGIVTEDTDKAYAIITKYIDDPKKWTPNFCLAVAYRIATFIAVPLTESTGLEAKMEKLYTDTVKKAGTFDGLQGSAQVIRVRPADSSVNRR